MSIFDTAEGGSRPKSPQNLELIKLLGTRLISRKDVKAIESSDGAWRPATDTGKRDGKRLPFTMADFESHLAGKVTLGHYLIGLDDSCKYFVFDIDLDQEGFYLDLSTTPEGYADKFLAGGVSCNPRDVWLDPNHPGRPFFLLQLRALAEGMARMVNKTLGIPVAILNSGGKGMHVYGFTGPRPAAAVRDLALGALTQTDQFHAVRGENFFKHKTGYENFTIEVFPKQSSLEGKDLGNLVRLPLGINRKSGNRSFFMATKADMLKETEMDPMRALEGDLPWE